MVSDTSLHYSMNRLSCGFLGSIDWQHICKMSSKVKES